MTRKELQTLPITLIEQNSRVILQWCTGLGKSKGAIDIANYLIGKKRSPINILLIVAESAHKSNWNKEFNKWRLKSSNVVIECYASLRKYKNTNWDLIIFDEAHHLGSDLRMDILSELKGENIILLSATLPDNVIQTVNRIFGEFIISKITLKEAIKWQILPEPKIYLMPLTLNNTYSNCIITEEWGEKEKRITYKCKFHERWEYLRNRHKYSDVTLKIYCTEQQKYNYLTDQFEYWRNQFFKTRQEFIKNKWLQIGSKRKRFLGELKTSAVHALLHKIQNKRFICFCVSIEQAEILGGQNAIHSKKEGSLRVIDKFNTKEINNIFAVGMLQEGQNLIDIEVGIITQLDGQERAFIQKFGRSLRAVDPIQFIFYYKNTRDEEYLRNALEEIDKNYIIELDNLTDLEL